MNLIEKADLLYVGLEEQLIVIDASIETPLKKLSDSLFIIYNALADLKALLTEIPFNNSSDEIRFFKQVKPKFYRWYICKMEIYNIQAAVPVGTDDMIRDYYMKELTLIKRNFNQQPFEFQYYLLGETYKDEEYFLTKNTVLFPAGTGLQAFDPNFTTSQDYNFSKFMAFEMLQQMLIHRIKLLYRNPDSHLLTELLAGQKRNWCGEKIELVELAYGIYYSGRMGNGKAAITDIIAWLEESLQVDLSQAYRMYLDIRRRKVKSHTIFLDEMREAIHSHIENTNSYKPKLLKRDKK
jgi:hypothetical protein